MNDKHTITQKDPKRYLFTYLPIDL